MNGLYERGSSRGHEAVGVFQRTISRVISSAPGMDGDLMRRIVKVIALIALLAGMPIQVSGQWVNQPISLRAGWNAVFLEVQPEPNDCDTIFSEIPVESVWSWNRRFTPVQFIQDPDELVQHEEDWLTYYPPTSTGHGAGNLFALRGGSAYLIKLPSNADSIEWSVVGRPVIKEFTWVPNSFNLVGFWLAPDNPPTFRSFFSNSPAQAGQPLFRLGASGRWERVSEGTPMRRGEAYWVRSDGPSDFSGPLSVQMPQRSGLDFGRSLMELRMVIQNRSSTVQNITVNPLPSEEAPIAPEVAGKVPLSMYRPSHARAGEPWTDIDGPVTQTALPPGQEWPLRVGVRRADMVERDATQYQGLLEIKDEAGSRLVVPVRALGLNSLSMSSSSAPVAAHAGLWVGHASITHVSEPGNAGNPIEPTSAGTEFPFRLLVHIDAAGTPTLLQRVVQLTRTSTSQSVLLTDDPLIDEWMALSDVTARQVSAAAFSFSNPLPMSVTGGFPGDESTATTLVVIDFDDPRNPFKHRYHPDHDNLDNRFENVLGPNLESYSILREITLEFRRDFVGPPLAGRGDNQLGGNYREIMIGLHKQALYVSGTFWLRRVSTVTQLNQPVP